METLSPVALAARRLLASLAPDGPRLIIGMAGVPGSGKSTLAAQIAAAVNAETAPDTMVALGMDGFHLTRAALRLLPDPAAALARRGAPWTFAPQVLALRLDDLRAAYGRADCAWPGFAHEVGDPVEDALIVPASSRIVMVEGLYLLHRADGWGVVSARFDERWYLDAPLDLAMGRLALRHMRAWGFSREQAEDRIAANDRPNAAIVVESAAAADWWLTAED